MIDMSSNNSRLFEVKKKRIGVFCLLDQKLCEPNFFAIFDEEIQKCMQTTTFDLNL